MDQEEIARLFNMDEEGLEREYQEMLIGIKEHNRPIISNFCKAISDRCKAQGFSDEKRNLITILLQQEYIDQMYERLLEKELTKPSKIPFKPEDQ